MIHHYLSDMNTISFTCCAQCKMQPTCDALSCAGCLGLVGIPRCLHCKFFCKFNPDPNTSGGLCLPVCELHYQLEQLTKPAQPTQPTQPTQPAQPVQRVLKICRICQLVACSSYSELCNGCANIAFQLEADSKRPTASEKDLTSFLPDSEIHLLIDGIEFQTVRQYCTWCKFSSNPKIQRSILKTRDCQELEKFVDLYPSDRNPNENKTLEHVLRIRFLTYPLDCLMLLRCKLQHIDDLKFPTEELTEWETKYLCQLRLTSIKIRDAFRPYVDNITAWSGIKS